MAAPPFDLPSKRNGDIFKPRYLCSSDSSIHANIVMVSAVLAHHVVLTDTKKEGVVFWARSQMQTEGTVFRTCSQMQSCGAQ